MKLRFLAVMGLFVFITVSLSGPVWAEEIKITGSTTLFPLAETAAEVFMEENEGITITVTGTGSGDGIKCAIAGTCDIGNASRDTKQKELDLAKSKGMDLVKHVAALDAIVPVVHPSNPVSGLTKEQLKGIYTGKIKNWNEAGGPDLQITVYSRDTKSGTFSVWNSLALGKEAVRSDAEIMDSNGAVAQAVASTPAAIGYVGFGYLGPSIKALKVNDVEATVESASDGSFPISRQLFMFTNGEPTGAVKAFIDFLTGPDGVELVADEGFIPAQ